MSTAGTPINGNGSGRPDVNPVTNPETAPRSSPFGGPQATPRDPTAGTFAREAASTEEVDDTARSYAEEFGSGARVSCSRQTKLMTWEYVGVFPASEFAVETLAGQFGPGTYRVVVNGAGNKRQGFKFTVAAPQVAHHVQQAPATSHTTTTTQGGDVAGLLVQLIARLDRPAAPAFDLQALVVQQIQSQGNLLQALLTQKTADPTSSRVAEFEAFLKVAEKIGRRGGGGDEEEGGMMEIGKALGAMFVANQSAKAPPQVRRVIRRVKGVLPNHTSGVRESGASAPAPHPHRTEPHTEAAGEPTTTPTTPAPQAVSKGGGLNPVALMLRRDERAMALAVMIHHADVTTQVDSFADIAAGALGEQGRVMVEAGEPGSFAGMFLTAFPKLAPKAAVVGAVEKALREMYAADEDEAEAEEDEAGEAEAGEPEEKVGEE